MDRFDSPELQQWAEDLYLVGGMSLAGVARATGVAKEVLAEWAGRENWEERRREYRKSVAAIRRNTVALRVRLLEKALESLDPRDIQAVAKLESAVARGKTQEETAPPEIPEERQPSFASLKEAVTALREAVERKIGTMLARPDTLSAGALRELKQSLDLMEKLEAGQAKKEAENKANRPKGLSDETVREIRRKILGIQ